jgi:hypothetical protein
MTIAAPRRNSQLQSSNSIRNRNTQKLRFSRDRMETSSDNLRNPPSTPTKSQKQIMDGEGDGLGQDKLGTPSSQI